MQRCEVIGKFSEVCAVRSFGPEMDLDQINSVLNGRTFKRWYKRNRKIVNTLALMAPGLALALFGVSPASPLFSLFLPAAMPVMAAGQSVPTSFFAGHGAILLHMLVAGFLTLVVTTFLKFTGRGDLIPLVVFVGGGVILYEVMGLYTDIYNAVKVMFTM